MQQRLHDLHMCFLSDMPRQDPLASCLGGEERFCRGDDSPLARPDLPAKQAIRSGSSWDCVIAMFLARKRVSVGSPSDAAHPAWLKAC